MGTKAPLFFTPGNGYQTSNRNKARSFAAKLGIGTAHPSDPHLITIPEFGEVWLSAYAQPDGNCMIFDTDKTANGSPWPTYAHRLHICQTPAKDNNRLIFSLIPVPPLIELMQTKYPGSAVAPATAINRLAVKFWPTLTQAQAWDLWNR